jgi:hypothetical protein
VNIPNSVIVIGAEAFRSTKLLSVIIPNSVSSIEALAFYETPLISISLPNSVASIGHLAFAGNQSLVTASIPDELRSLAPDAFSRSYSINSILYCGKLIDFPIKPTCPPERQAIIDKVASDKLAADKAAADKLAAAKVASTKKITITCVKGKFVKKVTAVKPVCPTGYKKK